MPDNYFSLVRREPFLIGYWRQNDLEGFTDAVDYASRFGLTGVYANRTPGPTLIRDDDSSMSSAFTASGLMSVSDVDPLEIVGDLSLEAWVSVYTSSASINVMSKQNSGATTAGPYALKIVNGSLSFSLGNGTTQVTVAGGIIPASLPTYVCATSFRGSMIVYINGVPVNSGSVGTQTVVDEGQSLIVGKTSTERGPDLISEVAIYNGALSARRIARHFAIGSQILSNPSHYLSVDPPVIAV